MNAKRFAGCLREDVQVCAYADNDILRRGEAFGGSHIISAEDIFEYVYDYIVVATPDYEDILAQLEDMGIDKEKVLTPFAPDRCGREGWREIFHVGEVLYYVQRQHMAEMAWTVENLPYEISAGMEDGRFRKPTVRSVGETLEKLRQGCSMSRYGDGELDMILNRRFSTFQEPDEKLIRRLKEILKSRLPGHLVCLPDIYGGFWNKDEANRKWFRRHLADGGRRRDYDLFDMDREYFNAFITRPYKDYVDKSGAEERFLALKKLWDGRDITVIEGYKTRFGVGNGLIGNAKSCERILGPAVNAFDRYEELLEEAKKTDKNRLVLIALGHTATVLAYDLAREGYQALDIGHLDIEYEWFLRKTARKIPIEGKYVNEVPLGRTVPEEIADEKYHREVVSRIY